MIGSPGFRRLVYGSDAVREVFHDYFRARGADAATVDLSGASDHAPFANAGIPVGGLYAGTEPCYHKACDTLRNVSLEAVDELADGAAHAIVFLEPR